MEEEIQQINLQEVLQRKDIQQLEKEYCVDIQVCSKSRVGELCVLLQSLRTQTFQNFNIFVLDDGSNENILTNAMFQRIVQRLKLEKHKVFVFRNDISMGVCKARNRLIEESNKENTGANLFLRVDDDVTCEMDYVERLIRVIDQGYDMSSGVTPVAFQPEMKRLSKFVQPFINNLTYDENKHTTVGDDCGYSYLDEAVIPALHLRSCFMYKKAVTDSGIRHELGINWFREETFFCARAILGGFTMAVDVQAKVYHYMTPSGGCRDVYPLQQLDEEMFQLFMLRMYSIHGDFLEEYRKKILQISEVKHNDN